MTERSRPWTGTVTGDAGPYTDDQWTDVWNSVWAPTIATDGVFIDQLNIFDLSSVAASPVSVASGRALVNGIWYQSDAAESVAIPTPAVNPRVDRIVLRADWALQTVRITRIAGAEAASPVPPALVQVDGTTWDLPLWQVHATTGGVLTFFRDDRELIGPDLYEPIGTWLLDDMFEGTDWPTGASQRRIWDASVVGSGSLDELTSAGFGVITFAHGGVLGDNVRLFGPVVRLIDNVRCELRVKEPGTDADLDRTIGLVDQSLTLTPNNGAFFRVTGAGNWFAVCRSAAVETAVDTGQALTNVYKRFEVRSAGTDAVSFSIDDVVVATIRTDVPTSFVSVQLGTFDDGVGAPASADYLDFDRLRLRTLERN